MTVGTHALTLNTGVTAAVAHLLLLFRDTDSACAFDCPDTIPPYPGFGVEASLKALHVLNTTATGACAAAAAAATRAGALAVLFRLHAMVKQRGADVPLLYMNRAVNKLQLKEATQV